MPDKPYPGLNPYSEEDAKRFFGRNNQIQDIIQRLKASRLTILYGESGVGKTSVVRAGVAAQLNQQSQENLAQYQVPVHAVVVFPPFDPSPEDNLPRSDLSWKDEPLPQLKRHIEQTIQDLAPDIELPEPELPFIETLQVWTERLGGAEGDGELFIILDQFEEYFLYHRALEPEAGTFAHEFPSAVNRSRLRVNFLISMRKDALAELDYFKGRLLNSLSNTLELGHLDWNSARAAIQQPIDQYYNQKVVPEAAFTVEEPLIDQVLKEVSLRDNHYGRIEAPYLQLVMESLWETESDAGSHCLRLQTLKELGGAEGIARRHLSERMERLSKNERDIEIAANVFHYLVTPSGSKHAYFAADLAALVNEQHDCAELLTEEALNLWLDKLTQRDFRLLHPVGKSPHLSYEIFHDVLAKPILAWLAEYWKEKEEKSAKQEAEQIRQEAEKIAQQKIEDARQEAQQEIEAAQLEVSQAELEVKAAKRNAKRWGLGGFGVAVFLLVLGTLGFVQATSLSDISNLRASYIEATKAIGNNESKLNKLNQEYLPKMIKMGRVLQQAWFLRMVASSSYSIQENGLMRLLVPALPIEKTPKKILHEGDRTAIWAIDFSPDGQKFAAGSANGKISLWNLQTQPPQQTVMVSGNGTPVLSMSFSPDGQQLATGFANGKISLWNLQTQQSQETVISQSDGNAVLSMSFSPDGQQLATGFANGKISLWNLQTQLPPQIVLVSGNGPPVLSMSFSPNGQQLAIASSDGLVRFWNLQNRSKAQNRPIPLILDEGYCLVTINFSRDGKQLAVVFGRQEKSECMQDRISLFDQQGKQPMYDYSVKKDNPVTRIAFNPNGKQVVTVSKDGAIQIWPIYTFDQLLDTGEQWDCTHLLPQNIKDTDISCPNTTNSSNGSK